MLIPAYKTYLLTTTWRKHVKLELYKRTEIINISSKQRISTSSTSTKPMSMAMQMITQLSFNAKICPSVYLFGSYVYLYTDTCRQITKKEIHVIMIIEQNRINL